MDSYSQWEAATGNLNRKAKAVLSPDPTWRIWDEVEKVVF
jgi:hypothetical protein